MVGGDGRFHVLRIDTDAGEREVVSFLDAGWIHEHGLCAEAIIGFARAETPAELGTAPGFQENPAFLRFFSRVIYEEISKLEYLRLEAQMLGGGHPYLIDGRTPDPGGRVPPEDILGTTEVQRGRIIAGSFQHNPRHRLLTSRGFFQLPAHLEDVLGSKLRARCSS